MKESLESEAWDLCFCKGDGKGHEHLSMPDPESASRMNIIREKLASMKPQKPFSYQRNIAGNIELIEWNSPAAKILMWHVMVPGHDKPISYRYIFDDGDTSVWRPPEDEMESCQLHTTPAEEWYEMVPLAAAIMGF